MNNNLPAAPFNEWVKKNLEENTPYDKWVYEMLTAEGKIFDSPATGYIFRDAGMPLDAMSNTLRVFGGTQIGCAQCHNHPFDNWTQKEFYEMAAFVFPTQTRIGGKMDGKNVVQVLREDLKKVDPKFGGGGQYNRFLQGNLFVVHDEPKRKLKLPHDYRYTDVKADSVVAPATIFGDDATIEKDAAPRIAFAKWLTSKDNPRFAQTIANRLWKQALGAGQFEPVDDIKEDSVAENPELMKFLTAEMIRVKFDMKEYLRILFNTETYQRQASVEDSAPGEPYHFAGPKLRRMTAEQAWDSFITLAVFNPEHYQAPPAHIESKILNVDLKSASAKLLYERQQELRDATSGKVRNEREKNYKFQGQLLVRASELPLPAPPGHFLREFGQSDRELIQAESDDGSVPQVLQMFNGPITHMLLEEGSLMYHNVMSKNRQEDQIDIAFLSVLSRKPSPEEMKIAVAEMKQHGYPGLGNIIWSLVNTREFLFIQ
jgi:hypothetical protein